VLRNVGPSVTYKLRDAAGQAREFNNYMLPVELDGQRVFLAGVRDTPERAVPLPAHPGRRQRQLDTWLRPAPGLLDPSCATRRCGAMPRRPPPPTSPTWPSSCV
jgi:cytochrome c biogenesis protein